MNFLYFFGLLSLMCFISQIRAWYWLNDGRKVLQDALKNGTTFEGYDVEQFNDEFKMKICEEARKAKAKTSRDTDFVGYEYPMYSNKRSVVSEVCDKEVSTVVNMSVKVFQCGPDENMTYYYGQGPYNQQVAVYKEYASYFLPLGIMQEN